MGSGSSNARIVNVKRAFRTVHLVGKVNWLAIALHPPEGIMSCTVLRHLRVFVVLHAIILSARAATHDEVGKCGLTGIYKMRQNILESPNYPDNYATGLCWDYVVRSPYRCPTKFHIQFLDFQLENSLNCSNDYLAIGFENDGDDMDLLCGQVIGIKKYHTPDGVLRLRLRTDDSPWTTDRGFKLLVTRLACERENLARENFNEVEDDTEQIDAPPLSLQIPNGDRAVLFRNFSALNQFGFQPPFGAPPRYPAQQFQFGYGIPNQLPAPAFGGFYQPLAVTVQPPTQRPAIQVHLDRSTERPADKPCAQDGNKDSAAPTPDYFNPLVIQQLPAFGEQYVYSAWPQQQHQLPALKAFGDEQRQGNALEQCCSSAFRQRHFYLSSPGFPRTAITSLLPVSQRDCQFELEKATPTVCRIRIEFKFFDFGQNYGGTGTPSDVCSGDYIEIDRERFCGCRTGYVHQPAWGAHGNKIIKMHMGQSGIPSSGFLLDISQEECHGNVLPHPGGISPVPGISTGVGQQIPQQQQQLQPQNFFGQQHFPAVPYPQTGLLQQPFFNPLQQQQPLLYPEQIWSQPPYRQTIGPIMPIQPQYPIRQFRHAKSLDTAQLDISSAHLHQPVTVVETNSTRKEYYYFDGADHAELKAQDRISDTDSDIDLVDTDLDEFPEKKQSLLRNRINSKMATPRNDHRCSFDVGAALRLTVDTLWITKPTCFAPLRSWFSNVFG